MPETPRHPDAAAEDAVAWPRRAGRATPQPAAAPGSSAEMCPAYAAGDGRTASSADCSPEVLEAWRAQNVQLGPGATWDGVDPTLRDAVTRASIDERARLYVGYTTNGTHAPHSAHPSGHAVDISRVDGTRLGELDEATRAQVARTLAEDVVRHIPAERRHEMIGPDFAERFDREPWTPAQAANLQRQHRDHVHISTRP